MVWSPTATRPTAAVATSPHGSCPFSSRSRLSPKLNVALYANSVNPDEAYGVSPPHGVGPDYYLSQKRLDRGWTNTLSLPYIDRDSSATGLHSVKPKGTKPSLYYYPDLKQTYGGMTYDANNFTLVFTGYFIPQQTGTHRFCATADNRVAFYLGSGSAFPCGGSLDGTTAGAKPLLGFWYGASEDAACGNVVLRAGHYYPIRSVFGNYGNPAVLRVDVRLPDGRKTEDMRGMLASDVC